MCRQLVDGSTVKLPVFMHYVKKQLLDGVWKYVPLYFGKILVNKKISTYTLFFRTNIQCVCLWHFVFMKSDGVKFKTQRQISAVILDPDWESFFLSSQPTCMLSPVVVFFMNNSKTTCTGQLWWGRGVKGTRNLKRLSVNIVDTYQRLVSEYLW